MWHRDNLRKWTKVVMAWGILVTLVYVGELISQAQEKSAEPTTSNSALDQLGWSGDWLSFAISLGALLGIITLVILIGTVIAWKSEHKQYSATMGFAAIGAMVGLMTGLSKTPIAGPVVSATLIFLGGIVAYIFSNKDANKEARPIIGGLVLGFGMLLMIGVFVGASLRTSATSNGIGITLEGHTQKYEVEASVNNNLSQLTVTETVDKKELFKLTGNGMLSANSKANWFGERMKISWPYKPGCDDVTVKWGKTGEKLKVAEAKKEEATNLCIVEIPQQ
ncbi:hypothetical protein HY230_06720 [Candidatus Acetothermia bacterium]|nr:hypothetical protein [Candidatus Acetothermia bacterium]